MMHDAVRGDVLLALFGAVSKDDAQLKEAQEGLKSSADMGLVEQAGKQH